MQLVAVFTLSVTLILPYKVKTSSSLVIHQYCYKSTAQDTTHVSKNVMCTNFIYVGSMSKALR